MQNSAMVFTVREISPVTINPDIQLARRAPRPPEQRQSDYVELYDYKTLFYDIFESGNQIIFSGPPLLNLESVIKMGRYTIFDQVRKDVPDTRYAWKTQRTSLPTKNENDIVTTSRSIIIDAGHLQVSTVIQTDDNNIFDNKKVIFTLSKNNDLAWIRDWAKFYSTVHGVNAILFYDNDSDAYSANEILEVISAVDGIETAVVVNWPFKYGPGGTNSKNWDSDYCQYGAMEHARLRFLQKAVGVLNNDIDELVVSNDGRSVFDWLADSSTGALAYAGRWVENVGITDSVPLHSNFRYMDPSRPLCTKKWCLDPRRMPQDIQWNVHSFGGGFSPDFPKGIFHRHFVGVNSNWKTDRTKRREYDPGVHILDEELSSALDRAFGAQKIKA